MVQVGWDTSSLKVLTSIDANGKVCETCCADEFGDDCGYCDADETPKYITVKFQSMAIRTTCCERSRSSDIPTSAISNHTVVCEQDAGSSCIWEGKNCDDLGTTGVYLGTDDPPTCATWSNDVEHWGIHVTVQKINATTVRVLPKRYNSSGDCSSETSWKCIWNSPYYKDFTITSDCVYINSYAWSNTACSGCGYTLWKSGFLRIQEGV